MVVGRPQFDMLVICAHASAAERDEANGGMRHADKCHPQCPTLKAGERLRARDTNLWQPDGHIFKLVRDESARR